MKNVICIGGGPAGLTAGYVLASQGYKVCVLEANSTYVGGISRTVEAEGFRFDIGGHRFFSRAPEVMALWREILGPDLLMRQRKSRIFYGGKFYPYPLNLWRTLANLGIIESGLCGFSYLRAKLFPIRNPRTFEKWVTNQFGARLFKTFFKTYTEKVWGMDCSEISADWAAQRIKGLSLFTALKNAVLSALGLSGKKDGIKTLIEEFLYPRKGPGMMWEAAAAKIIAAGSEVKLGCKVQKLDYQPDKKQWQVTYCDEGTKKECTIEASHVISSMPVRELVDALEGVPETVRHAASQLRYRDFLVVALVLDERHSFDDNWIYIHEPNVKVGRIQNFKSWSPEMVPDPALACYGMEYFCFEGDRLWNSNDDELVALATQELCAIGLADAKDVRKGFVVRQPKAYPVYDEFYQGHIDTIRNWLTQECPGLQIVGRNGMHKYNNQDHSMMTAMLAAKNIISGGIHYNVWQVNQDAEYHEEGELPGTTGERLVPRRVD